MMSEYQVLFDINYPVSDIDILLKFLKGEKKLKDSYRWAVSINNRIFAMNYLYDELKRMIPHCEDALSSLRKNGFCDSGIFQVTVVKYEVFLSSIYSLCENISKIIFPIYSGISLPRNFSDLKERVIKKDIDPDLKSLLIHTDWYNEVRSMRNESVHFLTGMITFGKNDEIGYWNYPKTERKYKMDSISVKDIISHIDHIHDEVFSFLNHFSKFYISKMDKSIQVTIPCITLKSGPLGVVVLSLNDFKEKKIHVCNGGEFDCPLLSDCHNRKNSKDAGTRLFKE